MAGRIARTPPNTFSLTYHGNPPPAVTGAIDYVLNLYDSWLVLSSVAPIRVNFTWENLTVIAVGLLGSASAGWANVAISDSDEVLGTAPILGFVGGSLIFLHSGIYCTNWSVRRRS